YLIIVLLALTCFRSFASVIIGANKIYYTDEMNSVDISVRNAANTQYLIVSKVMSENARKKNPSGPGDKNFAVIPPAFSLEGSVERFIRITNVNKKNLPQDKESLHFLSVTAIPEGKESDNTVQIAVRSWIKLIYRPPGLIRKEIPLLEWSRTNGKLKITNKSPFYVYFSDIEIQGVKVSESVSVEPFNSLVIDGCTSVNDCNIKFNLYNEDGSRTDTIIVKVI
ncbi:fimbrial biogenesis chaperone, partial [Serratia fonticola]